MIRLLLSRHISGPYAYGIIYASLYRLCALFQKQGLERENFYDIASSHGFLSANWCALLIAQRFSSNLQWVLEWFEYILQHIRSEKAIWGRTHSLNNMNMVWGRVSYRFPLAAGKRMFFLALTAGLFLLPNTGLSARNLLKNGNLERLDESENPSPGKTRHWTGYRWEGQGEIKGINAAIEGKRAIMIRGDGPSKQAIFQDVILPACTYRLSALVAGQDLRANHWKQSAALYVSFDHQDDIFEELFEGTHDWRRVTLEFTLKKRSRATVYFFNYGSGAFFVDKIRLQALKGCHGAKRRLTIGKHSLARLNYTPPLTRCDLALEGYCTKKNRNRLPFCLHLQQAKRPKPLAHPAQNPVVLADFKTLQPFEQGSWQLILHKNGAAARLAPGHYMIATPANGLPTDWRGQDWLSFKVKNPTTRPQKLYVEIHDKQSTGYWSRVNYYTMVPSGETRLRIPLKIFVGEKSVIQQRRRLDLAHITRLVFSAMESSVPLDLSHISLVPEQPYKNDFAQLIKLDVGPITSPVLYGFTSLSPGLAYRATRGFGYSADARQGRSEDRRHPGALLRDWTSLNAGGLDFDLPNGRYHVWMMLEDPGYWEYYPNFTRRKVMAEGKTVLDERMNAQQFLQKYYRHANDEDLPGEDVWQHYIRPRYKPLRFVVNVRDGQLNLRFDSADDPYALALSALIIYPDRQRKKGEAFLAELWQKMKTDFAHEYRQIMPPQSHAGEAGSMPDKGNFLDGALSIFQRSAAIDVHSFDRPASSELTHSLSIALAQGETAPLTLTLRGHKHLQLTGARLKLPGFELSAFRVRNKLTRLTLDGSVYWNAPRLLDPLHVSSHHPLSLPKGTNRRLWFDITASAKRTTGKIKSGKVSGFLALSFKHHGHILLPVSVTLHPWKLPQPDLFFGYLGIAPHYPDTPWPELPRKAAREMKAAIKLLSRHGMNRFSGGLGGPVFNGYEKDHGQGAVKLDFRKADLSMSLLKKAGKGPVDSYLGLAIEDFSTYRPDDEVMQETHGKPYKAVLRDILRAIKAHAQQKHWRPLTYVIGDEPDEDALNGTIRVARAFKAAGTGNRTSVFTSISHLSKDKKRLKLAGLVDLLYLNGHSDKALRALHHKGSAWALYNMNDRYHRGVYLYKLRALGCKGHMQYAFNSTHVDPWYDLDGRESDMVAAFTHPDGVLRPALDLKRYREAITDYRYLLKLERAIAHSSNKNAQKQAKSWLRNLLAKMPIGDDKAAPWSALELDQLRRKAAALIDLLS